jgi:hypothetical protein
LLLLQATTVHRAILPVRMQRLPLQAVADNLSLLLAARFDVWAFVVMREAYFADAYAACGDAVSVARPSEYVALRWGDSEIVLSRTYGILRNPTNEAMPPVGLEPTT